MSRKPSDTSDKKRSGYWYLRHVGECPVCGKDKSYKERVHDRPKPTDPRQTYRQIPDSETYDHCL